jgi:transcriptional regulator with XRE-family HTH domain
VSIFFDLWRKFSQGKRYRAAFARQQFKRLVPLQIQTLRRQRGWSQQILAKKSGMTQGVLSRAEDQDYGNLTVNTILNIAEGFDVAFVGRFVPFSELGKWYVSLSGETTQVPSFEEENASVMVPENQQDAIVERMASGLSQDEEKRFGNVVAFKTYAQLEGGGQAFRDERQLGALMRANEGGLRNAAIGSSTR